MLIDDPSWFTDEFIREALNRVNRQCETASRIGISKRDALEGAEIPKGWVYHPDVCYFLPPNVILL